MSIFLSQQYTENNINNNSLQFNTPPYSKPYNTVPSRPRPVL